MSAKLYAVPPGHIATVVTALEMTRYFRPRPTAGSPFRLVRWSNVRIDVYRALYRKIGEHWLWYSRLVMTDEQLSTIVNDPRVVIYAVMDTANAAVGLLELDFRIAGECEISFMGFVPGLTGLKHGRWLMSHALNYAWTGVGTADPVKRIWVHTCTLDHPAALRFYERVGFVAYERAIEMFPDPRLTGLYPMTAAPQVPIVTKESRAIPTPDRRFDIPR